jgi:hypothetical protein
MESMTETTPVVQTGEVGVIRQCIAKIRQEEAPAVPDEFIDSYLEAALWSSTDDDGHPLDDGHGVDDIVPATLEEMKADCADFWAANHAMIESDPSRAGYDFWLTRNGHGAGFWDGDWDDDGDALTTASKPYGEFNLYVGDDGLIYGS